MEPPENSFVFKSLHTLRWKNRPKNHLRISLTADLSKQYRYFSSGKRQCQVNEWLFFAAINVLVLEITGIFPGKGQNSGTKWRGKNQ
jgi:hypothetical protein